MFEYCFLNKLFIARYIYHPDNDNFDQLDDYDYENENLE
jgi:hypothetical protein